MERAACVVCRQVVGIYEPVLVRSADGYRRTSLVKEPALGSGGVELVHPACSVPGPDKQPPAALSAA
jgi:hypothetical protein